MSFFFLIFLFVSIFVVILLYFYFRMTGICSSFMVEIIKKIKEPKEAMKALKGHRVFFFFSKSDFVKLVFASI